MESDLETIFWLWESFQWSDVLDIGIMAFIAYKTLGILRGTRAFQVLVGLLFLLILYVLSERLELYSIHWLLDKFFVYIALAVVILFQRDIRRGLARAGGRLFPTFRSAEDVSILESLVKASFILASRRIGAIIAIEREASLDEYVEPGTRLDARISQELLLSVFHPTSPLHDGAIVIQKSRVAAAQVFLPLTVSKDISRFFGTRHRAALGLTEETDAVAIIVSEERGTVSLVQGGKLTPASDANELRQGLQAIFQPSGQGSGVQLQTSEG
ncbi:MAG: diadenylate cyclase CdaA [Myxococcota bacterium]|jgi:diadenylate cyclase|nr:diadenylate cyclase CdaA [Myxococcota bacterium]